MVVEKGTSANVMNYDANTMTQVKTNSHKAKVPNYCQSQDKPKSSILFYLHNQIWVTITIDKPVPYKQEMSLHI